MTDPMSNLLGLQPASPDPQIEAEREREAVIEEKARREVKWEIVALLVMLGVVLTTWQWAHIQRVWDVSYWWFLHATGADAPGSVEYNFWSGFGSDFGEATIVAAVLGAYKTKLNCQTPGCPWPGHHTVTGDDGVTLRQCHRCHPGVTGRKITHELLARVHREHAERAANV